MKSKQFFHQVFVIFVLLMTLFLLVACNQEDQVVEFSLSGTEFVSGTDLFSLKVPTGWYSTEVVPGADLVIANTEAALDRYFTQTIPESGDLILNIGFLPLAFFQENQLAHLGFQIDASPEIFLQSLLPMFRLGNEVSGSGRQTGDIGFIDEWARSWSTDFLAGGGGLVCSCFLK